MLLDLPDAATAVLVSFLDTASLRAAAFAVYRDDVLRPLADAFQCRFQLRLPPDTLRSELLLQSFCRDRLVTRQAMKTEQHQQQTCRPRVRLLATEVAVADTTHATDLLPIRAHVRGLLISSNAYTAWPERAFQWGTIALFCALERLTIDHAWERPIDLAALSRSAPQLQELMIKNARCVSERLGELSMLRVLHLEDTNIVSFAVAVGLPKLQALTLYRPYKFLPLEGVGHLADIAPLIKLDTRGTWQAYPRDAMGTHHETLREYAECGDTSDPPFPTRVHATWSTMVHLRSLRLGWTTQTNLKPFAALVSLEHLKIIVAWTCQHCVPLRRLTRLRELHIINGWVCDLVGYLPRLETLVWQSTAWQVPRARRTFFCRGAWPRSGADIVGCHGSRGTPSRLRRLVLLGDVTIAYDSPGVLATLWHVTQVEVHDNADVEIVLEAIALLRHLKRLAFRGCCIAWARPRRTNRRSFASAETLEELFYMPRGLADMDNIPLAATPLPLWFHDGLPNLRVLASPYQESMDTLLQVCPRLTHVHLPYSTHCAFWRTPPVRLRDLCVVTLALKYDCTWLRRERRPGGALPSLQRIFHQTTDCLSSPTCCRRRAIVGNDPPRHHEVFAGHVGLRAPWGFGSETAPMRASHERFHRGPLYSDDS